MVAMKQQLSYHADGSIDMTHWLHEVSTQYHLKNTDRLHSACVFVAEVAKELKTIDEKPFFEQSLEIAQILLDLHLDQETVIAGIVASVMSYNVITIDQITAKLGEDIAKLVHGLMQMSTINTLANMQSRDNIQIDRLRKILLVMASDIRVVMIKLAERICLMRRIKNIALIEREKIAQETMHLYAPLANRLGIGQLKWELEDLSFRYLKSLEYKKIATFLAEKRVDREYRIQEAIKQLKKQFEIAKIDALVIGRAKHIYSIYLKMHHKGLDYENIFDYSAMRILVKTTADCYHALSIVHQLWEQIPNEFDDYIAHPKSNGYRSIHTAVIGLDGKTMEIQIRTHDMHDEAEHGVAAHWMYKERKLASSGYEKKITLLRQLLAWHKDVAKEDALLDAAHRKIFEDRVYALTPAGDIQDLPLGATPLDFAYHVHTHLGHRCRGAKINGKIVPLTYALQTGDQVEIITAKNGAPSRDWLNKDLGYLKTTRARAKVLSWFKQQKETH